MAALNLQLKSIGQFFIAALLTLFLAACTDGRSPLPLQQGLDVQLPSPQQTTTVTFQAEVQYNSQPTSIGAMVMSRGSLFVTGSPFYYSIWNVSSNPENPQLIGAAAKNMAQFTPMGAWAVSYFGSGAIADFGSFNLTSGMYGSSLIDVTNPATPIERERFPHSTSTGQPNQDIARVYKGIVGHPTLPIIYGFDQQQYVYAMDASHAPALPLLWKQPYPGNGNNCCVSGATVFGGMAFVAVGQGLLVYAFGSDGSIQPAFFYNQIQAINVAATDRFLYVQSKRTVTSQTAFPDGIYVFNLQGQCVAYLPLNPILFAPSPLDTDIYAEEGQGKVNIYRIN